MKRMGSIALLLVWCSGCYTYEFRSFDGPGHVSFLRQLTGLKANSLIHCQVVQNQPRCHDPISGW